MTWFVRYPDRYQMELKALQDAGIEFEIDEELIAKGVLRLIIPKYGIPNESDTHKLTVVFPDTYPWFRPQVYACDLNLPRHQNPHNKSICLLPRATEFWKPEQTVVDLLLQQFAEVLNKGVVSDIETVRHDPTEQAEPYSDYFSYAAHILFDSSVIPIEIIQKAGSFHILGHMIVGIPENASFPCRMAVKEVYINKEKVYEIPKEIRTFFTNNLRGVIVNCPEKPPSNNPSEILTWLHASVSKCELNLNNDRKLRGKSGDFKNVIALTFPEELKKGEFGPGWIFLVEGLSQPVYNKGESGKLGKKNQPYAYLAKPSYLNAASEQHRVPKLHLLSDKRVAIIGLGALGSFASLELARVGIRQLRIIDFDYIDPGTSVRFPFGAAYSGLLKIEVIAKFIRENYLTTEVITKNWRLGTVRIDGKQSDLFFSQSEWETLDGILDGVDLILDATAEMGVNNFLSRQAYLTDVPYLSMYATPGAWGGVVMRYLPGQTGCWSCMKQWQKDDSKLVPSSDLAGEIQPPGCGDLTFTGAGFDLQQISIAGVKLAVSTLSRGIEGGYPDVEWDWAVINLTDKGGKAIAPEWRAQKLLPHPDCPYHGNH